MELMHSRLRRYVAGTDIYNAHLYPQKALETYTPLQSRTLTVPNQPTNSSKSIPKLLQLHSQQEQTINPSSFSAQAPTSAPLSPAPSPPTATAWPALQSLILTEAQLNIPADFTSPQDVVAAFEKVKKVFAGVPEVVDYDGKYRPVLSWGTA
jgi:hypothetical protein